MEVEGNTVLGKVMDDTGSVSDLIRDLKISSVFSWENWIRMNGCATSTSYELWKLSVGGTKGFLRS